MQLRLHSTEPFRTSHFIVALSLRIGMILGAIAIFRVAHAENIDACLRGQTSDKLGKYAEAIDLYESCIKTGQLSVGALAKTYRNTGITYRHAKNYSRSIAAFGESLALLPEDPWSDYINRGNSYDDAGDFARAMADYDMALKLNPEYGEIYYNRGITYEHQKSFKQAAHEFYNAYQHGLRSDLLYERLVAYGMLKPDS